MDIVPFLLGLEAMETLLDPDRETRELMHLACQTQARHDRGIEHPPPMETYRWGHR